MLIYGIAMILVIIFKPDGLFPRNRKKYTFEGAPSEGGASPAADGQEARR